MNYKNIKLEKTKSNRNLGLFEIYSSRIDLEKNKNLQGYSVRMKTHRTSKKKFSSVFKEELNKQYDIVDEEYGVNYFDYQKLENAEMKFKEMLDT